MNRTFQGHAELHNSFLGIEGTDVKLEWGDPIEALINNEWIAGRLLNVGDSWELRIALSSANVIRADSTDDVEVKLFPKKKAKAEEQTDTKLYRNRL